MKEKILKFIKEKYEDAKNNSMSGNLMILYHLISLIDDDHFQKNFEYYFQSEEHTFYEGFRMFHKSMRQVDFYEIGEGHLDMIFWNFIHINDIVFNTIKEFMEDGK